MNFRQTFACTVLMSLALGACADPASGLQKPVPPHNVPAQDVVFTGSMIPDGPRAPLEIGIWAPPTPDRNGRLVVISHGSGGDFRNHEGTALALARAGFVVAALTHTGDNWRDRGRSTDMADRVRQLSVLIDFMTTIWDGRRTIDANKVGAFGFSSGGFTVLAAAGGAPDMSRIVDHCHVNPRFFDCRLASEAEPQGPLPQSQARFLADPRIRSLVVAAPALGFTFASGGLRRVTQPVQLWQAAEDQILPSPFYAEIVRDALPTPPEYHRVQGAGHFDFIPPCSRQLADAAPAICTSAPGFDRGDFHDRFSREVVRFFREALR